MGIFLTARALSALLFLSLHWNHFMSKSSQNKSRFFAAFLMVRSHARPVEISPGLGFVWWGVVTYTVYATFCVHCKSLTLITQIPSLDITTSEKSHKASLFYPPVHTTLNLYITFHTLNFYIKATSIPPLNSRSVFVSRHSDAATPLLGRKTTVYSNRVFPWKFGQHQSILYTQYLL